MKTPRQISIIVAAEFAINPHDLYMKLQEGIDHARYPLRQEEMFSLARSMAMAISHKSSEENYNEFGAGLERQAERQRRIRDAWWTDR